MYLSFFFFRYLFVKDMDESFSRLIFGMEDQSLPDSSCCISNYKDHDSELNFHSIDQTFYSDSYHSETFQQNYMSEQNIVANMTKENSPYESPNLSTEESENENDPFSQRYRIPVPGLMPISRYHLWLETSFMCRRNERERQRVRNVNDGFSRLRNHLPRTFNMRRRQSKVETLQHAIKYIKHLQSLLEDKKENEK